MKNIGGGLKYSFTIMAHPIRGFYEMRFENQGNVVSCILLLLLMVASLVFQMQYTGFIFNGTNLKRFNIVLVICNVVIPVLLWCIANWSITVLMDGEGRFVDIFMATSYATVPFTITTILSALLSRVLTADEKTFIGLVAGIGVAYTALLLFCGILTVHQFTVAKNIVSIVITIAGMAFIVFLMLLFASIFDKLYGYIAGIITEIQLRT